MLTYLVKTAHPVVLTYLDEAFMLLNCREYPSWLYPILLGATTIWERWDGIKTDGSFQDKRMNSFNHYAYGAIGDWLYKEVAGINPDPDNPGFRHVIVAPKPGGNIRWANGSLIIPYGIVESAWNMEENCFDICLPPNTYGTVRLPGVKLSTLTENGKPVQEIEGVQMVEEKNDEVVLKIGSGRYHFEIAH